MVLINVRNIFAILGDVDQVHIGKKIFICIARGCRPRLHLNVLITLRHPKSYSTELQYFSSPCRYLYLCFFSRGALSADSFGLGRPADTTSFYHVGQVGHRLASFTKSSSACFRMLIFARAISSSDDTVQYSPRI